MVSFYSHEYYARSTASILLPISVRCQNFRKSIQYFPELRFQLQLSILTISVIRQCNRKKSLRTLPINAFLHIKSASVSNCKKMRLSKVWIPNDKPRDNISGKPNILMKNDFFSHSNTWKTILCLHFLFILTFFCFDNVFALYVVCCLFCLF